MNDPSLAELKDLVESLAARVNYLEGRLEEEHPHDEVPPDVRLVIAAACAAYLGKRAKVRQVRLRRPRGWVTQGRTDLAHSHTITGR